MGYPLSVIRLICGRYFGVCKHNITVELKHVEYVESICGVSYHRWAVSEQATHAHAKVDVSNVANYCVILPKLSANGVTFGSHVYTLIDSDWNDIQKDGSITLSRVEGAAYSVN
jgi:hypothetical protein